MTIRKTITGQQLLKTARAIRDKQNEAADLEEDLLVTLDLIGGIQVLPDVIIEKLIDNLRCRHHESIWLKLYEEQRRREREQLTADRPVNGATRTVRRLGVQRQPLLIEADPK